MASFSTWLRACNPLPPNECYGYLEGLHSDIKLKKHDFGGECVPVSIYPDYDGDKGGIHSALPSAINALLAVAGGAQIADDALRAADSVM